MVRHCHGPFIPFQCITRGRRGFGAEAARGLAPAPPLGGLPGERFLNRLGIELVKLSPPACTESAEDPI